MKRQDKENDGQRRLDLDERSKFGMDEGLVILPTVSPPAKFRVSQGVETCRNIIYQGK